MSAATYWNISERSVRQLIRERRIDSVRIRGPRRIPADAVDAYVKRNAEPQRRASPQYSRDR